MGTKTDFVSLTRVLPDAHPCALKRALCSSVRSALWFLKARIIRQYTARYEHSKGLKSNPLTLRDIRVLFQSGRVLERKFNAATCAHLGSELSLENVCARSGAVLAAAGQTKLSTKRAWRAMVAHTL
jgi:hypothetical protein